ncbi:hypothetical protein G9A89_004282 [Geosiphon pyriformis]|nr:hypothetical protein G9A89_004282 [Geosiphon pyriformis]
MFSDKFATSARFSDLDAMWGIVCKIMVLSASKVFKKKWFKSFDNVFTKESSRFHKLKLLVSKIVKASHEECVANFESLMECWVSLDNNRTSVVQSVIDSGAGTDGVYSAFFSIRRSYHTSKLTEFLRAKEANIRSAINKRIESFEMDKGYTIRSMLKQPFHKVVLDYLVMGDELVFEPDLVKSKTKKRVMVDDISNTWSRQYRSLDYIFDEAFSRVMCVIDFDELYHVVSDLPDGKAAGLSGISNELWKHCDESVLGLLLVLLNSCLSCELVPESVFTNTHSIALIETACKILFKILSDRILLACSSYDVLHGDNFSVLKGMTTQSPIFAIGLDMQKAYNLVGWEHLEKSLVRIKIYSKFIQFFGSVHKNCTNHIMTNFGLMDDYHVHDGLDQGEVFSLLLWHIFYDPLLCEVKRQKSVYGYRLNSYFVFKSGCTESQAGLSSFFAASAFHIFNVASEFFHINDILINNNKTVAISINSRVSNSFLSISGLPISITKKGESHWYLGIFLLTEGLSKPSLAKANSDVHFFTNLVLRKVVLDKQFLYLVLTVLHSIISYRTQFSFVSVDLKLKSGLLLDFPSDTIHHPSFYGLKSFSQFSQTLVGFWGVCSPIHPLISPTHIHVSVSNNFLAGMVSIFFDCKLSLGGSLASAFWFHSGVPMSVILGESLFFKFLSFLRRYDIAFVDQLQDRHGDRLNPHGPVPEWFVCSVKFLVASHSSPLVSVGVGFVDICGSDNFLSVCDCLSWVGADSLSVYTDESLKNLGTTGCRAKTAAFFKNVNLGLDISIWSLVLSTLAKLQTVTLALECIPVVCSVCLFSDSQAALDACMSEINLVYPNFRNHC